MGAGLFSAQGPSWTHSLETHLWTVLSVGNPMTLSFISPFNDGPGRDRAKPQKSPQTSGECSLVASRWSVHLPMTASQGHRHQGVEQEAGQGNPGASVHAAELWQSYAHAMVTPMWLL